MASAAEPPWGAGTRRICGPVWCARRGRNAVVSLITPPESVGQPYIQWCSLVGVDVACDEKCVCVGARWVSGGTEINVLARDRYLALSELVASIERRLVEAAPGGLPAWREWARSFAAGVCSASAAWRAAESARCESVGVEEEPYRRVALAAEDVAWAVAHAAVGNQSLSLQRAGAAHQLLNAGS